MSGLGVIMVLLRHDYHPKAVKMSVRDDAVRVEALSVLSAFRTEFYRCLTARADALFEVTDALLCTDGPVRSLVDLVLAPEHRRGHGAMYAALEHGRVDIDRLRRALAATPMPRADDGRLVLAVDITCWLRPQAPTSPERILCHTYGRGKDQAIMIPGWPYSVIVALEPGRSSWTAPLDAVRLAPGADAATVTAHQLRGLVERLVTAGHWQPGDLDILVVVDAGYDVPRLAHMLGDLPVQVLGRMRSDRVLRRAVAPRVPGTTGRPPRHGGEFAFGDPTTWGEPDHTVSTQTRLYGPATVHSWDRLHPRLTRRAAWYSSAGLPIIEGTVLRLQVARLPSGAIPKPVWLWWSRTGAALADVDRLWHAFLRRFDIEHTFRMLKQTLGWTSPKIRSPHTADRWTWLILTAYTQLRLARPMATDLRRPWEKPMPTDRLTPARVRRGFRHLHAKTTSPAAAPKPSRPGPGRPPGRTNTHQTPRYDIHVVGANTGRADAKKPKPDNPRPRRTG